MEINVMSKRSWPLSSSPIGALTLPAAATVYGSAVAGARGPVAGPAGDLAGELGQAAGRGIAGAAFAPENTHNSTRRGAPPRGRHR